MNKRLNTLKQISDNTQNVFQRRFFIKSIGCGILASIVFPFLPKTLSAYAATEGDSPLIVYYSRTGNTRTIAQYIQEKLNCNTLELKTKHAYPDEYRATTDQAKEELANNFKPELDVTIPDLSAYNTIFIGYPNWWGTMPMALYSFLEQNSLASKVIVPFCTHEGSGLGRSITEIKRICPDSNVKDGLAIRGGQVNSAQENVLTWLNKLGY